MFCPKCARENPDQNKFCNGCGASLQVEFIPPQSVDLPSPPLPPQKPPVQTESSPIFAPPQNSFLEVEPNRKDFENFHAENFIEVENLAPISAPVERFDKPGQHEDLSKVFEDAEMLIDEILTDKKKAEPDEFLVPETTEKKTEPISKVESVEVLDDYFSEVEKKYRVSDNPPQSADKSRLIVDISAIAGLIILVSLIGFGWYFMGEHKTPQTVAENKTPVIEKPSITQPPTGMVYVAGGEFTMGSDNGDEFERPAHRAAVKPFYIDKTEVTCEEYKKFVDATGYAAPSNWQNNNFPADAAQKPVTGVNWDDATAFAKWQNKRLPREDEWEFAARGTDGRVYPWGSDWKPEMANADKQKTGVQEVGLSKGASPFGILDMSGNAWEWTASDASPYPNGKSFETNSADAKIIRGGFFGSAKDKATTTFRRAWGARSEKDYSNTGFRCVRDISVGNQTTKF